MNDVTIDEYRKRRDAALDKLPEEFREAAGAFAVHWARGGRYADWLDVLEDLCGTLERPFAAYETRLTAGGRVT